MKIGDNVVITNFTLLPALVGCQGVIVEEKIPSSHAAMLNPTSTTWHICLHKPFVYQNEEISQLDIREECLALI